MKNSLYDYLLYLGDNSMMMGHRLSELCGHGPSLETDIALTNISLDLFGQVRNYYQYAAELEGAGKNEDQIAFMRFEHEYKNVLLTEQPNTDFAYVIVRQFYFDAFHLPLLEQLAKSKDEQLAAIASKSLKEVRYHLKFSSDWIVRLGDGTDESKTRIQSAANYLWNYTGELFQDSPFEAEMKNEGIGADLALVHADFNRKVTEVFNEAGLEIPKSASFLSGGKKGIHSEHMGFILAQLQYMQRAYPQMSW